MLQPGFGAEPVGTKGIFSMVKSGAAQRSFWRMVPFAMIAPAVSPTLTPIAVTMPGQ